MFIKLKLQNETEGYVNTEKIISLIPGSKEMTEALITQGYVPFWQKCVFPENYTLVSCNGLNNPFVVYESIEDVIKKIEEANRMSYLNVT